MHTRAYASGVTVGMVILAMSACVPIPRYSTTTAKPGSLILRSADDGVEVPEALMLPVEWQWSGVIDGGVQNDSKTISKAVVFHTGDPLLLGRHVEYTWIPSGIGAARWLQGILVLAPGYAPKFFMTSSRRPRERGGRVWRLTPLPHADAEDVFREYRKLLRGKSIGLLAMEKWEAEGRGVSDDTAQDAIEPNLPIDLELSEEDRQKALRFLDKGIALLVQRKSAAETGS